MTSPTLLLSSLKKTYFGAQTVEVLKAVELEGRLGESIAIVGQSGSGKSTLLSLLAGLDHPTSGKVTVEGRDLARLSPKAMAAFRAESLGIVFQQFHLMPELTALENVMLPLELTGETPTREIRERAHALLKEVGMGARVDHFPRQLSGGECQRVAIARSLIHRPKILLADEPTGNLDQATAKVISDLLFRVTKESGSLLILVTHSLELSDRCDRKFTLQDGLLHAS